jgi:hypothetical protein
MPNFGSGNEAYKMAETASQGLLTAEQRGSMQTTADDFVRMGPGMTAAKDAVLKKKRNLFGNIGFRVNLQNQLLGMQERLKNEQQGATQAYAAEEASKQRSFDDQVTQLSLDARMRDIMLGNTIAKDKSQNDMYGSLLSVGTQFAGSLIGSGKDGNTPGVMPARYADGVPGT